MLSRTPVQLFNLGEAKLSAMSAEPPSKKTRMPVTLGYWKIRGLAQPIRLLLKYTGTEFENITYDQEDAPHEAWQAVKDTLGLDFPNLPYLIDGKIKLTQSSAILRYIARKHDLCGKTEGERVIVDMMDAEVMDFRNGFVRVTYNPKYESMRADYITNVKNKLKRFSDFLADKPWSAGNEITYPDFPLYELLDQHRTFEPTILKDFSNLRAFLDRFEALPAIKEYMQSDSFMRYPINSERAQWVGQ